MRNTNLRPNPDDMRVHCVCYLVSATLASYGLTQTWSLAHLVESTYLWQARYRAPLDWMMRVQLGQLALKLCREYIKEGRRCPKVQNLFTETLTLDLESPSVAELWDRCREALAHR